jgi:hypothetical protein
VSNTLSGLQEVNFWEVSRIFRAGQIFWTRSAVKVGNRVGNQILGIKKGVELYGLTPCYYCGGDDEDRTRDLPAEVSGTF